MSNRRRSTMQATVKPQLPPIITEDDGELPFLKQDYFSDVAIIVSTDVPTSSGNSDQHGAIGTKNNVISGKKLYTARSLLAYNSPVFEKSLSNAKKHELDLTNKNYDDVVELLCYLDPRVEYTLTAQTAKQLLPLSEEYEIQKLRNLCADIILSTYETIRSEYSLGTMPGDLNEEYLVMSDRYGMPKLLDMCIDEYVARNHVTSAKSAVNSETLSEKVKLLILQKKLAKLNSHLEKERKFRAEAETKAGQLQPKSNWKKYWHADEQKTSKLNFESQIPM